MRALLPVLTLLVAGCLGPPPGPPATTTPVATPAAAGDGFCPSEQPSLHSVAWLAERIEVTNKLVDDHPNATRPEDATCLLGFVAPQMRAVDGGAYDDVTGWMNVDGAERGADGELVERWRIWIQARLANASQPDLYGADVDVSGRNATLVHVTEVLMAVPPARVAAARDVFESSAAWSDVRERAPHLIANNTRWTRDGSVELFYSSYGEGGGIPEHPFAFVTVYPDEGRVGEVRKSDWWGAPY